MTTRTTGPLQNRVNPFGQLCAVEARGRWMGNRGILHDVRRRVTRPWQRKAWITCQTEYKGNKRPVFAPGKYSELFFLDEATAYAAGHRPCGMCRRDAQVEFLECWLRANHDVSEARTIPEVDEHLHEERIGPEGDKRTFLAEIGSLPQGTFFELDGVPHLLWGGRAFAWSFEGYTPVEAAPPQTAQFPVLTPRSVVAALRHGLAVQVHESVRAASGGMVR